MKHLIVVLSDGETWSKLEGCFIAEVDESELDIANAKHMEPSRIWHIEKLESTNGQIIPFNVPEE